jgi:hypothetical protein
MHYEMKFSELKYDSTMQQTTQRHIGLIIYFKCQE